MTQIPGPGINYDAEAPNYLGYSALPLQGIGLQQRKILCSPWYQGRPSHQTQQNQQYSTNCPSHIRAQGSINYDAKQALGITYDAGQILRYQLWRKSYHL